MSGAFGRGRSARDAATSYAAAGWRVVPIPERSKAPVDNDWPNRIYTPEQITGNVGVMLGPASGHLADADIDSYWALLLAPYFLPDTARFGRASKLDSHWLFLAQGLRTRRFTFTRGDKIELIELRAKNATNDNGGQTVFPGSIHQSGERVDWSEDSPNRITEIDAGDLIWRMTRIATCAVIAEEMREGNQRNNQARAWAGGLLESKWTAEEVRDAFSAIYDVTGADEAQRAKDLGGVERTIIAYESGANITSFGTLIKEGLVRDAVVRRAQTLCRTPDTLHAELKIANTTAGKSTAERIIREAQNTDLFVRDADEVASNFIEEPAEQDADPFDAAGLEVTFFDAEQEPHPLNYVWGPFAAGKTSAIVGYGNTSKTPFALELAIAIAEGKPAFGMPTSKRRVLYLVTEGARNTRRKAQRIARARGTTLANIPGFDIAQMPSGSLNAESVAALCKVAIEQGIQTIFLDTFGSAVDGNIDRNSAAYSDALKQMGDESDKHGIVFIVLLHERKENKLGASPLQRIDGHNSVGAALQGAIALSRPDETDKTLINVTCARAPDDEFEPFAIRWKDVMDPKAPPARFGQNGPDPMWGLKPERVEKKSEDMPEASDLKMRVVDYVRRNAFCTANAIAGGVIGKAEQVKAARIELQQVGIIIEVRDGKFSRYKLK